MRGKVVVAVSSMSVGGTDVSFDGQKVANGMNALETITFLAGLSKKRGTLNVKFEMPFVSEGLCLWETRGEAVKGTSPGRRRH